MPCALRSVCGEVFGEVLERRQWLAPAADVESRRTNTAMPAPYSLLFHDRCLGVVFNPRCRCEFGVPWQVGGAGDRDRLREENAALRARLEAAGEQIQRLQPAQQRCSQRRRQ